MANDVEVALVLTGVNEFMSGMQTASQGVYDFEKDVGKSTSKLGSAFDSVRSVGGSVVRGLGRGAIMIGKGVATAAAIGVGAVAGLTGAALKAGFAYNVLYQKSFAAFKVILKSGKAADKMMSGIADFAHTSPFPRQAFIEASQQMLGFGIKAKDVIPTLGVIQDTVAAMGGGAADILSLTDVFSKIQSQGKLTGQALQQLGQHGVDAAGLLGKQWGISAAQVREQTAKGAIGAEKALTGLRQVLGKEFGGAASEVKKTWVGSTDSIKGALRDIGSMLLEPFISTKGGGMAITWANEISDALWSLKKNVIPMVAKGFEMIGKKIAPWVKRATDFFKNLKPGKGLDSILGKLKKIAPLIAGFAGFGGTGLLKGLPFVGQMFGSLNPLLIALGAIIAVSPELRGLFTKMLKSIVPLGKELLKTLVPVLSKLLTDVIKPLIPQLPAVADAFVALVIALTPLLVVVGPLVRLLAPLIGLFARLVKFLSPLAPYIAAVVIAWYAWNAALVIWNVLMIGALWPIYAVIAAIVAIGVVVYLLVRHWDTIKRVGLDAWHAILGALRWVWNWVKANWPLLVAMLLGPFALAAVAILRHRDQILDGLKRVWNWVKNVWAQLGPALTKPFREMVGYVEGIPGKVGSKLQSIPGVHTLSGVASKAGHVVHRQHGGPVSVGGTALVGEKGPELVHFPAGGHVSPLDGATIRVPVFLDKRQIAEAVGQVTSDKLARR